MALSLAARRFDRRFRGRRPGAAAPAFLSYAGAQSINADGFTVQDDDATAVGWGATQNPDGNGVPQNNYAGTDEIHVRRAGFSGVEVAANPVDTLTVRSRFRQRFPDHGLWEAIVGGEVRSTLSEFIYASDAVYDAAGVQGGVVNNSLLAYPLPIPRWLNAPYTRVAGADKIYLFVDHAYARAGAPVAAVRLTLDDGVTSIQVSATSQSKLAYSASGLTVPCYEFAPDWSALASDALITIDAEIYPWVGTKYQASVDGFNLDHTPNFGVLRMWNAEGVTPRLAYVDPTTPSGTPVTSTDPATAAGDPYDTILNAATALAAAGGGTCGTDVIRLVEDTHTLHKLSGIAVSDAGLVIEPAPGANPGLVNILHDNINDGDALCDLIHVRNVKIQKDDSDFNFRWGSAAIKGSKNYQCLENVTFELIGAGTRENTMWDSAGVLTVINCSGDDLGLGRASRVTQINAYGCGGGAVVVGSASENPYGLFNIVACAPMLDIFQWSDDTSSGTVLDKDGCCVVFNKIARTSGTQPCIRHGAVRGARGFSLSGNVLESAGTHTGQTLYVNADGNAAACQNILANQVTAVGDAINSSGRINWMYSPNVTATDAQKRGFMRNALIGHINTKCDVFEADGTQTGNEAAFYRVGHRNVMILGTSASGSFFAPGSWMGEIRPPNTTDGQAGFQNPGFADDQSHAGGDLGGGDYTPTIANMASDLVPANDVCFRCDLEGNDWALDGTDAKGAVKAA